MSIDQAKQFFQIISHIMSHACSIHPMTFFFSTQSKSRFVTIVYKGCIISPHSNPSLSPASLPLGSVCSCHTGIPKGLFPSWTLLPQGLYAAVLSFGESFVQIPSWLIPSLTCILINIVFSVREHHAASLLTLHWFLNFIDQYFILFLPLIFLHCIFHHVIHIFICLLSVFLQVKHMVIKGRDGVWFQCYSPRAKMLRVCTKQMLILVPLIKQVC